MSQEEKPVEVHVDLSRIEEKLKKIEEMLSRKPEPVEAGKGEVLAPKENRYAKILEALKSGSLKEQWMAPISISKAPIASLIDYIKKTGEISGGRAGDVVSIPYVKDITASDPSGGNLVEISTGDLYGVATTTLTEKGAYSDIPYGDIEKLTEDLLGEIEASFERGIIRAIDAAIVSAVNGATGVASLDKSSASVAFDADWLAEAMVQTGKDMRPEEYVLVITPGMYLDLYKDIAGSQALVFARPDVVREGLVAEFMGVRILVLPKALMPTSSTKKVALLIHRNAVVFAPKREMLFETDRMPKERKVRFAGSYTFGLAVVDPAACCKIVTGEAST